MNAEVRIYDEDAAEKLLAFFTESAFDAIWHFFFEIDLRRRWRDRQQQKAALARYARIPWHAWAGRPVVEIDLAMSALNEVLEREGAAARTVEDT